MILCFLLLWHRQVFRSSVLKLELCPSGISQNNFFFLCFCPTDAETHFGVDQGEERCGGDGAGNEGSEV